MLSQLKRSIPDLRLHKTTQHQPLVAQSTPPSSHRQTTPVAVSTAASGGRGVIRRQSSFGAYHHPPPEQPLHPQSSGGAVAQAVVAHHVASAAVSSSTSYYTNSPSPPHVPLDATTATTTTTTPTTTVQQQLSQQHTSVTPTGGGGEDFTMGGATSTRAHLEQISSRLDQLTRRVHSLENTLAADVRAILLLLQHQQGEGGMPEYENLALDPSSRSRHTFQRSVSEPKPISNKNHSHVLHRFASFNKAFDFDKYQEPSWAECLISKEAKEPGEEKTAPIAKLESLDELDLESPLGSPKKQKK
ncbi:unnamed protein product [Callosobruchus maculatus]|uniref:Uncharacterized protein n=1 Tax=Callosobruchus maculatus TaxID=64391 RepID=A0A653DJ29_CALMS|nr:unnamed protein product [Callosobruchus maculatus]